MLHPIRRLLLGADKEQQDKSVAASKKPGDISLEERTALIRRLGLLYARDGRDLWMWKAEIEAALASNPLFLPLHENLQKLSVPGERNAKDSKATDNGPPVDTLEEKPDTPAPAFISKLHSYIDAAIRIVELQKVTFIGDDLSRQVDREVRETLWRTFLRVAPFVSILLFGGAVFGAWTTKGLINDAYKAAEYVKAELQNATSDIEKARATAVKAGSDFKTVIDQETQHANDVNTAAVKILDSAKQKVGDADNAAAKLEGLNNRINDLTTRAETLEKNAGKYAELVGVTQQLAKMPQDRQRETIMAALLFAPYLDPSIYAFAGLAVLILSLTATWFAVLFANALRRGKSN